MRKEYAENQMATVKYNCNDFDIILPWVSLIASTNTATTVPHLVI